MGAISEMEERFDDLLLARSLASTYLDNAEQENDVVKNFLSQVNKLIKQFRKMIAKLSVCGNEEQFDACIQAYTEVLDGRDIIGKFVNHWKNNVAKALVGNRVISENFLTMQNTRYMFSSRIQSRVTFQYIAVNSDHKSCFPFCISY